MTLPDENQEKNIDFYNRQYSNYSVKNIIWWLNHLDGYLEFATKNETSWFGLYMDDFKEKIRGKRVLEMGSGDCNNAAVMAALGAEVFANDIAVASGEIVNKINENFDFRFPIRFVEGDFLKNNLEAQSFDYVVGKAFLHHLTVPVERNFLKETARLLKQNGEARFFEPAVNNSFLDEIRWHIPVKGRPSKLNKKAFRKWKENDPHPDRSFSSKHFKRAGREFFEDVRIVPIGTLERFRRIIPGRKFNAAFTRWALKNEKFLPHFISNSFARSQVIIYRTPFEKSIELKRKGKIK